MSSPPVGKRRCLWARLLLPCLTWPAEIRGGVMCPWHLQYRISRPSPETCSLSGGSSQGWCHRFVIRTSRQDAFPFLPTPKAILKFQNFSDIQMCPLLTSLQKICVSYYFAAVNVKLRKIIPSHFLTFLVLTCSHFHLNKDCHSSLKRNKQIKSKFQELVKTHSPKPIILLH